MYKFYNWVLLRENITFPEALVLFNYKPGDYLDPLDYKKRLSQLTMMNHPDRGGNHDDMVRVNLANEILKSFIGNKIPGGAAPVPVKAAHWADDGLHGATKQVFGKWLHVGMMQLLEESERNVNSRDVNKLFDTINHLGHLLGDMKRAFEEWRLRMKQHTLLDSQDFDDLLEKLEIRDDSAKAMRLNLKTFRQGLFGPFYDKYIKTFAL